MSSTMNLSRAFTRETRYLRSSDQTLVIAPRISFASSFGTKTPMSRAIRGTEERPPPTRTAKPSRPSWTVADQRDAVDLRRVAAVGAGGDRVLVLARQVRPVGVAVEEVGGRVDDRRGVEELVGGDPLDGAAGDVAHGVAAAAGGRDARRARGARRRRAASRARASGAGCSAGSRARRRPCRRGSRPRRSSRSSAGGQLARRDLDRAA